MSYFKAPTNLRRMDDAFIKEAGYDAHDLKSDLAEPSKYDIYYQKGTSNMYAKLRNSEGEDIDLGCKVQAHLLT